MAVPPSLTVAVLPFRAASLAAAIAAALLAGCASQVSLDDPDKRSGSITYFSAFDAPSAQAERDPSADRGLWVAPVAVSYSVRDTRVATAATPGWNPATRAGAGGWAGVQGSDGRAPGVQKSAYEFQQRLDDGWVIKQSVRYGRPTGQPGLEWIEPGAPGDTSMPPGLGTFAVGSQAQGKLKTFGYEHQLQVGFDYSKSRDIIERRWGPAPTLDIFAPGYGTDTAVPRVLARSYAEQHSLGIYVQDQVQVNRWVLSLVGRRDLVGNRTIDLMAPNGIDALQDDETLSGRIGLRYQFPSGLAPYINYSQTYAPVRGSEAVSNISQQIETGVRFQPVGLGQAMTLTAYNQFQNNAQVSDAETGCAVQGCKAWADLRTSGATVESKLQPIAGLNVVAAYNVSNSVVENASADAYAAMLSNRYPAVSQQEVSVRANYAVSRGSLAGLSLDGRVGHTGASYSGSGSTVNASFMLVDAGVNYDFGRLSAELKGLQFRASANNLLDQGYWAYCYLDTCAVGAGRSVSAILNYQVSWP